MGSASSVSSNIKESSPKVTHEQPNRTQTRSKPPAPTRASQNARNAPALTRRSTSIVSTVDTGYNKTLVSIPTYDEPPSASGYTPNMNYNDPMYDPEFGRDAVADLVGARNVPPMMWQQGKQRSSISFTTKGLQNAPGANNCFLNSAVQVSASRLVSFSTYRYRKNSVQNFTTVLRKTELNSLEYRITQRINIHEIL